MKIIHDPRELMNLSREELDELLLEEYKNSALLRELVRVSLLFLKKETEEKEFYKNKQDKDLDKFEKMREEINKVLDIYRY